MDERKTFNNIKYNPKLLGFETDENIWKCVYK